MGGSITVIGESGVGSVFTVDLPIKTQGNHL
jgi:signal transduction histidine kinase